MGKFKVIWLLAVGTLLAMAKALLNATLISSMENVLGSPATVVHSIVIEPPEVGFWGMVRVSPATKGATKARRATLLNIFSVLWIRN